MTTSALSFFVGTAAVDPWFAGQALTSESLDVAALEDDLTLLESQEALEEPAVEFLRALHQGKIGQVSRARAVAKEKLAPAVANLSPVVWTQTILQTQAKRARLSGSKLFKARSFPQRLDLWIEQARHACALSPSDEKRIPALQEVKREWAKLVQTVTNPEELNAALKALRETERRHQIKEWGLFLPEAKSPLRRIALAHWKPGTFLPSNLFHIESTFFDLDETDRLWVNRHIGKPGTSTRKMSMNAWQIIQNEKMGPYERLMAAILIIRFYDNHSSPFYGVYYLGPVEAFHAVVEQRAAKGNLDLADLLLIGKMAYHVPDLFSLDKFSQPALEAILQKALELTPMTEGIISGDSVPFHLFYREEVLEKLSNERLFAFVEAVLKKGIRLKTGQWEVLVANRDILKRLTGTQRAALLEMYREVGEQIVRHSRAYLEILGSLPWDRWDWGTRYERALWNALDAKFVESHPYSLGEVLKYLHKTNLLDAVTPEAAEKVAPTLIAIAEEANRIHNSKEPSNWHELEMIIFQNALQILSFLNEHLQKKDPSRRSLYLPAARYIETWLARSNINFSLLFSLIKKLAPLQDKTWRKRIAIILLRKYASRNPRSRVYFNNNFSPDRLNVLVDGLALDDAEFQAAFEAVEASYYQDPFSSVAPLQRGLFEWREKRIGAHWPAKGSEEWHQAILKHSRLKEETKERIDRLTHQEKYPLTPAWRLLLNQTIVETHTNKEQEAARLLEWITQATSVDGMVHEWILLLRDLRGMREEDRLAFMRLQNERFQASRRPDKLIPPKIRRTLRVWQREKFIERIGLQGKEAGAFRAHYHRFRQPWGKNNFIDHLSHLAGFVNAEGLKAIRALVLGIVGSPTDAEANDFGWSFRYRGMERQFGKTFASRWKSDRHYAMSDFGATAQADDPDLARREFARGTARQLGIHLSEYVSFPEGPNNPENIQLPEAFAAATPDILNIYQTLKQGRWPEREPVERTKFFLDAGKDQMQGPFFAGLREVRNDLGELLRGWDRSFDSSDPGRVIISGDPRNILRAGHIGRVTCTQPTGPAAGNMSGEPAGRCCHGPLMIIIVEKKGGETARTFVEAVPEKDGIHLTAWPLYTGGGFYERDILEKILLADGAKLGVPENRTHIEFTGRNMKKPPQLLPARFPTYPEGFQRQSAPP